jgi:urease accessory protein
MSVAVSPFDAAVVAEALAPVRAKSGVAARFAAGGGRTVLRELSETGGYRLRFPRTGRNPLEAVLVNPSGGVVGGDRITLAFAADRDADVAITTQAAERVYRALAPAAEISVRLDLAPGACLAWLPQETILYSGARMRRRFEVDTARSSHLIMSEIVVFGRVASGERMGEGCLWDAWRVRRDGPLVLAEAMRLDGAIGELLARPAVAAGARAVALMLYAAADAEARLDSVRAVLRESSAEVGASAWNGLLVARVVGPAPDGVRTALMRVVECLRGRAMPRVWSM